jgi:hypothetical protein
MLLQPFDTRELNIYNKKDCKKIYGEVKGSVEDGLQVYRVRKNVYVEVCAETVSRDIADILVNI